MSEMTVGANGNTKARVRKIKALRAGQPIFESTGYSYVKVTKNGEAEVLELPIQSTGVAEVMERLRKNEPRPPKKAFFIEPSSAVGRMLKLSQKEVVYQFDLTDAEYVVAKEQYDQRTVLEVINQGLAVEFEDGDGTVVKDMDRKIDILRGLGLSMQQFNQIVGDINSLSTLTDGERTAFFATPSDAAPRT